MAPTFNFHFYESATGSRTTRSSQQPTAALLDKPRRERRPALDPEADDLSVYYHLHRASGSIVYRRRRIPRRSGSDRTFRAHQPP